MSTSPEEDSCLDGPKTKRVTHSDTWRGDATPSRTYFASGWDFGSESEGACMCVSVTFQDTACVLLEIISGWI